MQSIITQYLEQTKVGRKQSYKNLALFPLLSTYSVRFSYLLLDEALSEGVIEVVEVDKEGSVPELKVINKSSKMVLILDGEELVGAKQNRVVNTTIMIKENSSTVIPVSCVEHGRWSYSSASFRSENRMMSSNLRSRKVQQVNYSVRCSGEFRSDQGAIWEEIAQKAERMHVDSPTGAMASIYEKQMPSIQEYTKQFSLIDGQVGAVFMINGKVIGMDGFGKHETFGKVFNKLLSSYAIDAIDWYHPQREHKALKSKVTKFMTEAKSAEIETHPSVGLGTDLRVESDKVIGFALSLEDQILHLCIFPKENGQKGNGSDSGMVRFP